MGLNPLKKINNSLYLIIISGLFCSCVSKIKYASIKTESAPVIDGQIDNIWSKSNIDTVCGDIWGENNRESNNDISVNFRSLWDSSNLYFLFEVWDDVKLHNPDMVYYQSDLVSLYFTPTMKKTALGGKYVCWCFMYGLDTMIVGHTQKNSRDIDFYIKDTQKGYTLEIKAPWKELGLSPQDNLRIPFNIEISDMDKQSEGGISYGRETNLSWTPNLSGNSWARPKEYGELMFIDTD